MQHYEQEQNKHIYQTSEIGVIKLICNKTIMLIVFKEKEQV